MEVPFLDLKPQYRLIREEIEEKLKKIFESQQFILGEEGRQLEEEIAEYCQVQFAIGVSSGTDALLVSLMALDLEAGAALVTTPFTFIATAGAPARLGLKIIFVDIEPLSFNLDVTQLAEKLSREINKAKIKAIIPVHLFGQMVEMKPLLELAQEYDLKVIEDAAQAIGAEYPHSKQFLRAGSGGELGILSFFPSKNLGGAGDGGMVLTSDLGLREKIISLRNHGAHQKYLHLRVGGNFRLDELQAAVLRVKLKYLPEWISQRQARAENYERLFQEMGLIEEFVKTPPAVYKTKGVKNYHTYHQYVIRVKQRDELREFLLEKGIQTAVYYPIPLHLQPCFRYLGYQKGDFPQAEQASAEVLALPIYPELPESNQEYVVAAIREFFLG